MLKASHEEVVSVNEELQASNEELETGKEEMQSLNEELHTVNAQLRAKVEEQQATSGDLTSLLASTDIAVLFLDPALRIRRYTQAARELVDLIPGDVGRPLVALARRFDYPHLDDDCRAVLERLVPVEREVPGDGGRHYLCRVTAYRTTDNRIDGVVVAFVEVTARKRAEDALRASEALLASQKEAFQAAVQGASLDASLGVLARAAVQQAGADARCGIFMADSAGAELRHVAGMSESYASDVDGVEIGPDALSCGLAAYTGQPVITPDVTKSPRWEPWLWLAERHDFHACWAFPIEAASGKVVGTLAMYFESPRGATPRDLETAAVLTRAAGIIISRSREAGERARAEAALRASEEQFRRAIEDAPIPVIMQAEDGEVLQVSRTWTELTGYGLADLPTADAWLNRAYGPGADTVRAYMRELFAGERKSLDVDFILRTQAGHDRHWSFSASAPEMLRDGRRFMVGMAVDVTERRRAEYELRMAQEASRMGIWTLDPDAGVHMRDAIPNRLLGLTPVDSTQPFAEFLSLIHPDDQAAVKAAFDTSVREGRPLGLEFRIIRPDGEVRWLRDQGDIFGSPNGGRSMAGACVDITERREVEDALRASEERLRRIVESATDFAIFTLDADRAVTSWSPGAEATFGWPAAEIIGRPADVLFTPEDRATGIPEAETAAARRNGRARDERWHLRKDGSRFFASGVLAPLGPGGGGFVKVLRDLTDRKQMEDALARDARILASVHDAVIVTDPNGVVAYTMPGSIGGGMSGRLKVAVADDERDTREYLQEFLDRLGYEVRMAEDGRRLVELCREFDPDVVVTDYAMPGLNGLAAAAEINRERHVPVILLSGKHEAEAFAEKDVHVIAFLAKPVKPADLKAAVEAAGCLRETC